MKCYSPYMHQILEVFDRGDYEPCFGGRQLPKPLTNIKLLQNFSSLDGNYTVKDCVEYCIKRLEQDRGNP